VGNGGEAQDGVASDRWPGHGNPCSPEWILSRLVCANAASRPITLFPAFFDPRSTLPIDLSLVTVRARNHGSDFLVVFGLLTYATVKFAAAMRILTANPHRCMGARRLAWLGPSFRSSLSSFYFCQQRG